MVVGNGKTLAAPVKTPGVSPMVAVGGANTRASGLLPAGPMLEVDEACTRFRLMSAKFLPSVLVWNSLNS